MYSSWAFFFYYAENITPDEFYNRLKDGDLILNGVAYITDGYVKGLEPAEADIHEDAIGWPRKSKSKKWVSPKADPIGTDTRLTHEPGFIRAEDIELDRPGVFLFSENNYPGWRVEVDGHRAEILTVDATLMGVQLDAGRHTVEFTFDPPRFRIGLWVSIISLVLAAILGIIGAIRRR
jgi:hypothetical protein